MCVKGFAGSCGLEELPLICVRICWVLMNQVWGEQGLLHMVWTCHLAPPHTLGGKSRSPEAGSCLGPPAYRWCVVSSVVALLVAAHTGKDMSPWWPIASTFTYEWWLLGKLISSETCSCCSDPVVSHLLVEHSSCWNDTGSNRSALAMFDCKILQVSAVFPTKKAFSSWAESQVPF